MFLKRQKVPKVVGELDNNFNWRDFNLSTNMTFFDRSFRIYDCDAFTKEFYAYMDCPLNEGECEPSDNFEHFIKTK